MFALALLTSLAIAAPPPRIGRHPDADVCFHSGAPVGWTFLRTFVTPRADRQLDLGWSYQGPGRSTVTVYVYPEEIESPDPTVRAATAAGLAADAVPGAAWRPPVVVTAPPLPGEGVLHAGQTTRSIDGDATLQQLVAAWSLTPWTVKIRATWSDTTLTPDALLDAVLPWGARPCASLPPGHPPVVNVRRARQGRL